MTVRSSSAVNQKLAFSQSLLSFASTIDSGLGGSERLQHRALIDAAISHLACAHRHYLRELLEGCGVTPAQSMESEESIQEELTSRGKNSVEIEELLQLRDSRSSWLTRLLGCYTEQWSVPLSVPKIQPVENPSLIKVTEIRDEPESSGASLDDVKMWHQLFRELVQRQRETTAEY